VPLTDDQMTATLDLLNREADTALAVVNAKTQGFFHGIFSGDTGGGERTLIDTVKTITIPTLERMQAAATGDLATAQKWTDLAQYAEESLNQVQGYVQEGTVGQILKDTVTKTAADVKQAAVAAAAAVPYAAFGGGVALVLVLGVLILLYAPHPR
jgi:hypothetical protein